MSLLDLCWLTGHIWNYRTSGDKEIRICTACDKVETI